MSLLNHSIRKHISEINNVRIGTAFPLDTNNMFKSTTSVIEQAKSNLINLLLTVPGERVSLPNFGVGLKKLLFENDIDHEVIETQIKEQSKYYIPNIVVMGINIGSSEEKESIFITVRFYSLLDNTPDSIQLNFK